MTRIWEIDVGAQQFDLTDGKGEINVAVRNGSSDTSTAFLDLVVAPEIAGWFTIEQPQRDVPPGATTIYKVKVSIPPNTDPGEHAVIPRVYTATEAPEETSEMGGRVLLTVPAPAPAPAPRRRFTLWWLAIALALILIAAITTVTVIATRPDDTPTTGEDPLTPPSTTVVPDLTGLSEDDAMAALAESLLVPTIKHRHDPAKAGTVVQDLPPGLEVAAGTPIEVVFHVNLSAPIPITPANNALMPRATRQIPLSPEQRTYRPAGEDVASQVDLAWSQDERYVTSWRVQIQTTICFISVDIYAPTTSFTITTVWTTVTTPSFSTIRYNALSHIVLDNSPYEKEVRTCGENWSVGAVDDFGNVGPMSTPRSYSLAR